MPIIFKSVGTSDSKKYEIKIIMNKTISLCDIEKIFEIYGMNEEDLSHIKFVANSETMKSNDKKYLVSDNENLIVFVFSPVKEVKEKIEEIFIKNNTIAIDKPVIVQIIDTNLQKNIDKPEEVVDVIPTLDDETVKTINEKTSSLYQNEDFKQLVRIYYTNQDIVKTFLSFIVHGDIVKLNIPKETEKTFESEISVLKGLGIKDSDENIRSTLNHFNGHLNLTLRALLTKNAVQPNA